MTFSLPSALDLKYFLGENFLFCLCFFFFLLSIFVLRFLLQIVFEKVRLGALEIVEQVAERKGEFGIPHTLSLSFDASPFLLRGK